MYVIMGGSGHDAARGGPAVELGAEVAVADVNDVQSLRAALQRGRRAFLLNPPPKSRPTPTWWKGRQQRRSLRLSMDRGLRRSSPNPPPPRSLVSASATPTRFGSSKKGCGAQPIPAAINRAAYYMSNWDLQLDSIRKTGKLQTNFPADFEIPMVAPRDLGLIAADRLTSPIEDAGVRFVEGPQRYSSADVAKAFAEASGQDVEVVVTPRDQWIASYLKLGFSQQAAESYSRMTGLAVDEGFDFKDPIQGPTTLEIYVKDLVDRQTGAAA